MAGRCLSVGVLVADQLCAPISHVPRAGELILTDRLELAIGGCASNAAIDGYGTVRRQNVYRPRR